MIKIEFNEHRCKACGLCAEACPKHIIIINKDRVEINGLGCAELTENSCIGCKSCATVCPDVAISIYKTEE